MSATGKVGSGSIPGRVEPKCTKIDINIFPVGRLVLGGTVGCLHRVWWTGGSLTRRLKIFSLSNGRSNLANRKNQKRHRCFMNSYETIKPPRSLDLKIEPQWLLFKTG